MFVDSNVLDLKGSKSEKEAKERYYSLYGALCMAGELGVISWCDVLEMDTKNKEILDNVLKIIRYEQSKYIACCGG